MHVMPTMSKFVFSLCSTCFHILKYLSTFPVPILSIDGIKMKRINVRKTYSVDLPAAENKSAQ